MCGCHRSVPACLCEHQSPHERCGDTAGLRLLSPVRTRIHKYSCFLGFFLSYAHIAPAVSHCRLGTQQGWVQSDTRLYTQKHAHTHTEKKVCKRPKRLSILDTKLGQRLPVSVPQPFLSPSLVAFNFEDREQGASARLEKEHKAAAPDNHTALHSPFKQTPIYPAACQDSKQENRSRGDQ